MKSWEKGRVAGGVVTLEGVWPSFRDHVEERAPLTQDRRNPVEDAAARDALSPRARPG